MRDAAAQPTQIDIDDVERALRAELSNAELIGELNLDTWGELSEQALRTRVHRCDPAKLRRLWPATFATYLVYQGLHVYEDARFWNLVTIPELRNGQDVGPEFEAALEALHLPTFDDLETLEGFAKGSRGRYIRRIHLHGGIPRDSVAQVMRLLDSTLRAGASSADDVLDFWSGVNLAALLKNKAAERCVIHARGFAVTLIGQLIELVRRANTGDVIWADDIPSHLVAGVDDYVEEIAANGSLRAWNVTRGPQVCIDPHHGNPYLEVPQAYDVVWSIDDREVGVSSRQTRERFALPVPDGEIWTVESDDGATQQVRRFATEAVPGPVLVFDERGRLHQRGAVLGGLRAYVVAPEGVDLTSVVDQRSLDEEWAGFELFTLELRACGDAVELASRGSRVRIPIQNTIDVRLSRGPVDGLRVDGQQVMSGMVTLAFDGFTPLPEKTVVEGPARSVRLSDVERHYGEFDVTRCFDPHSPSEGSLSVRAEGLDPVTYRVTYVPQVSLRRPRLSPPTGAVETELCVGAGGQAKRWKVTVPDGNSEVLVDVDLLPGRHGVTIEINRLQWELEGPHTLIPLVDGSGFSVRLDQLHDHRLLLKTQGVPVRVALLDSPVHHEETARRDRHRPAIRTMQVKAFSETARATPHARTRMGVLCDDEPPIEVGIIETRYEATAVTAEVISDDESRMLAVEWEEISEWPSRCVRLWASTGLDPIASVPVPSGERFALVPIDDLEDGSYLVEIGVRLDHLAPSRPNGRVSCQRIYIGSETARRLRQAVDDGDRREPFSDEELDELVPLLAHLLIEQQDQNPTAEQRLALLERIADDHWRFVEVVTELDDILADEQSPKVSRLEPYLIDLVPLAWVNPITDAANQDLTERIEHMWEIAPILAACLDRASPRIPSAAEDCEARWVHFTGLPTDTRNDLSRRLDRLARAIPERRERYLGSTQLLSPEAWSGVLWEADIVDRGAPSWQALESHRPTALQVDTHRPRTRESAEWSGVPLRIRNRMRATGENCDWITRLVTLSCELLQPTGAVSERAVLDALKAAQAVIPLATRTALIYSAAALRLRENLGPLARLVT